MRLPRPLHDGVLVRRYKRFLADVRLDDGRELTVHCASPGAMTGCAEPGSRVVVSDSGNPKRKLPLSWELVRVGRGWVAINSSRTNAVVAEALAAGAIAELAGVGDCRSEVVCGASRIDFCLEAGGRRCWVEVKNVTLAEGDVALFPDAVTARGRRHVDVLADRVRAGDRAVMLYVVSRTDCARFAPAAAVDREYAVALAAARRAGVEVLAYSTRIRRDAITIAKPLPVDL